MPGIALRILWPVVNKKSFFVSYHERLSVQYQLPCHQVSLAFGCCLHDSGYVDLRSLRDFLCDVRGQIGTHAYVDDLHGAPYKKMCALGATEGLLRGHFGDRAIDSDLGGGDGASDGLRMNRG